MIRNVFISSLIASLSQAVRETERQSQNTAVTTLIGYTYPTPIPGNKGFLSIVIVLDQSSSIQEASPMILTATTAQEIINILNTGTNTNRKLCQINESSVKSSVAMNYNALSKAMLTADSPIDVKSGSCIVAGILSEDLNIVVDYINRVKGDRSRIMFETINDARFNGVGRVVKESNKFIFEDGLIITVTGVMPNPDGSYNFNYDLLLNNEIMRAAKQDSAFSSLIPQQQEFTRGW